MSNASFGEVQLLARINSWWISTRWLVSNGFLEGDIFATSLQS